MSTELDIDTKVRLKEPRLYKVLLLNDDFTPQDFVVEILMGIFNKTLEQAYSLMIDVHEKGQGLAGVYTKEVADQKVMDVSKIATQYKHPLQVKSEPV